MKPTSRTVWFSRPSLPNQSSRGGNRLFTIDCDNLHASDESRRSMPAVNVGKPIDASVNCYLTHHKQGCFLRYTGISLLLPRCLTVTSRGTGRRFPNGKRSLCARRYSRRLPTGG